MNNIYKIAEEIPQRIKDSGAAVVLTVSAQDKKPYGFLYAVPTIPDGYKFLMLFADSFLVDAKGRVPQLMFDELSKLSGTTVNVK